MRSQFSHRLLAFVKAIPHSYATAMYSDSRIIGLALMALTIVSPYVGLAGLFALLIALLFSRLLGFEGWDSASGVLSFNSLLIGLTIGYYYPYSGLATVSWHFVGLITVASLTTFLIYIGLNYLTQTWLKLPSLSLAFCLAAILFWYYLVRTGYFTGSGFQKPLIWSHNIQLSWFWKDYFMSLGSIVFVPDVLAGIVVAFVLLLITRIGFMLSLWGWAICFTLLQYVNISSTYGMFFPGFNLILISLAVGSVFLIPGKTSYLLAIMGTVLGFIVALALSGRYYYSDSMMGRPDFLFLPIFALPVNLVVLGMIFALRLRIQQRSPIINDYGILHPEKALDAYLSRYRRFSSAGVPQLHLPVSGEWVVTQAHNGAHTHKQDWALAWDFEIVDSQEKKYSEREKELRDYYSFGKQVFAAAAGYVVKVVNSIPDNPVGGMNTLDNWGNYVSISHGYGIYTLYAHLKEGSIKLAEGDYIKQGEKLGQVGNSGRSPVPHLHFHAQMGVDAGSKTIFSHIINYKVLQKDGSFDFVSSGIPDEEERITAFVPEKDLAPILQLSYGQHQSFKVISGNKEFEENWIVELDLAGNHSIVSDNGTKAEFSIFNGIYNSLSLSGRRQTALAAFTLVASRLPWAEKQRIKWQDEPSLSIVLNPFWKNLALFLIPFFKPIRVKSRAELLPEGELISLKGETRLSLFGLTIKTYSGELLMSRKHGIRAFNLSEGSKTLVKAEHIETASEV
jgi:urea transporter